jgi:hypothetical protein
VTRAIKVFKEIPEPKVYRAFRVYRAFKEIPEHRVYRAL